MHLALRGAGLAFLFSTLIRAQNSGIVEINAVDCISGAGISGVEIQLKTGKEDSSVYLATTDSSGAAHIDHVTPGDYAAVPKKDGFKIPDFDHPGAAPFHVAAGAKTRLRLELLPLGSVSGTVLDSENWPLSRRVVEIRRPSRRSEVRGEIGRAHV